MPYIVTTTTPEMASVVTPGQPWPRTVSRRAVATLEEARDAAHDVMLDRAGEADPVWPEGSNSANWNAVDRFPESGGTVGPLPDGTTIEVAQVTAFDLKIKALASPRCTDADAVAAFNAQQAR